jgi:hypothetical protein
LTGLLAAAWNKQKMPETDGSGRLDRIEAILHRVGEKLDNIANSHYLHEERLSRVEALHEANERRWKEWREERRGLPETAARAGPGDRRTHR